MRKKRSYTVQPAAFKIAQISENEIKLTLRENIEQVADGWQADEYYLFKDLMTETEIEAAFSALLAEAKALDKKAAAEDVRSMRDGLLLESDRSMLLDRIIQTMPMTAGAADDAWIGFVQGIYAAATNEWAVYRQALRDIPTQAGFPYDVVWPVRPDSEVTDV